MPIRIARVEAAATYPLRREVLRPHQPSERVAFAGDDQVDAAHFVALDGDRVIGTATVHREPPPWDPDRRSAWRLRGMATAAPHRRRGVGAATLGVVLDYVAGAGGGLVWCNARVPAVAFYQRAEFATRGEPWTDPEIGPHIAMAREVAFCKQPDARPSV